MCKGLISGTKSVIPAFVAFKAHLVKGQLPSLAFLIDTGAEKTMVNAGDAEKLDIEYKMSPGGIEVPFFGGVALKKGPLMGGVGGGIQSYEVPDVELILITEMNDIVELHGEHLDVLYVPEGRVREIPSLLGMDVLSRFNCTWNHEHLDVDLDRIPTLGRYWCSYMERSALGLA